MDEDKKSIAAIKRRMRSTEGAGPGPERSAPLPWKNLLEAQERLGLGLKYDLLDEALANQGTPKDIEKWSQQLAFDVKDLDD